MLVAGGDGEWMVRGLLSEGAPPLDSFLGLRLGKRHPVAEAVPVRAQMFSAVAEKVLRLRPEVALDKFVAPKHADGRPDLCRGSAGPAPLLFPGTGGRHRGQSLELAIEQVEGEQGSS